MGYPLCHVDGENVCAHSLFRRHCEHDTNVEYSLCEDFTSMFEGSGGFTAAISQWDTSSATTMEAMFKNASSFTSDLAWDTSSVTSMAYMFYGASVSAVR